MQGGETEEKETTRHLSCPLPTDRSDPSIDIDRREQVNVRHLVISIMVGWECETKNRERVHSNWWSGKLHCFSRCLPCPCIDGLKIASSTHDEPSSRGRRLLFLDLSPDRSPIQTSHCFTTTSEKVSLDQPILSRPQTGQYRRHDPRECHSSLSRLVGRLRFLRVMDPRHSLSWWHLLPTIIRSHREERIDHR